MKRTSYSILILVTMFIGLNQASLAQNSRAIDSLTTRLQDPDSYRDLHDTDRVNTLNDLAWQLMYANPDTAIFLSSRALSVSEASGWQSGIANSIGQLGAFNYLKGDYPKALEYYFKALKIAEEVGGKSGIAANLSNIGIVYMEQGNYPKALDYYFKSLSMDEEIPTQGSGQVSRKTRIATKLVNIGNVYAEQGDYPKALEYYFKALKMNKELGNKNFVAVNLGNIGNVYRGQGDSILEVGNAALAMVDKYPKALEYFSKALKIHEELGNKNGIAKHLSNMGLVYSNQGDFPKALEHYSKALKMNEELGNKYTLAANLGNIGSLYTKTGEFDKADIYLQKALSLSREIGVKKSLQYQYEYLSNLYDTIGKPALAFEAYKLYIIYRDSLINEENIKAQTRTEMKYEYEKAELVKKQEEKEQARIEAEATGRRDNLQYSVILIALMVLFGGVLSLGFVKVSPRMAEGIIFFSFLILFEFLLVLADPYIDKWSGGAPGIKLLFNAGIAALIFPMHSLFETKLKKRLVE